jgi:hypothetical protein
MDDQGFTILHLNDAPNIIQTTNKLLTTHIGQYVKASLDKKSVIHTAIIDETETHIYQLCYLDETKNGDMIENNPLSNIKEENKKENKENLNKLASKLMINKQCIYGDAVFFRSKLTEDGSCLTDSITIDDYNNVINKRDAHVGCFIEGTTMKKIIYTSPEKLQIDNWLLHSSQIFGGRGFNLEFVYEGKGIVNKFASVLAGIIIKGSCYVLARYGEEVYDDISTKTLERLYNVCKSPLSYRNVTDEEMAEKKNNKNLPIVKNRFYILKTRECELGNKFGMCWVCGAASTTVCTGCYRLNYCSKNCHQLDWSTHKEDCLHYLTKFIKQKTEENKI